MPLSHDEKLKLDNFREHRRVLLRDIQDANKELEAILSEKNLKNSELSSLKEDIKESLLTLSKNRRLASDAIMKMNSAQSEANRVLEEARTSAIIIVSGANKELEEAKENLRNVNQKTRQSKDALQDIQFQIKAQTDYLESLGSKVAATNVEIAHQRQTSNSLINMIGDLEASIKKLQERKKDGLRELDSINAEIEDKRPALDIMLKNIQTREKAVAKREADAKVLVGRIERWYKKNKPHIKIKL